MNESGKLCNLLLFILKSVKECSLPIESGTICNLLFDKFNVIKK